MERQTLWGLRLQNIVLTCVLLLASFSACSAEVAFEKLTDMDYRGTTYYTIRNLTLYECQGWCREEPECQAASFSFVSNPLTPVQETVCLLQNETAANNPSAVPKPAISTYYMIKLRINSDKVCNRPWTFERLPKKMLRGLDNALMFVSTKEACLAACLNEERFICRSAEYSYLTLQCHLSEHDRRSVDETIEMVEADQVDYFENLCLSGAQACKGDREFPTPEIGVPNAIINRYVDTHYYVDLELMANNVEACRRACEIENEILCRSFLYRGPPTGTTYNCQLFHMDHVTLPDGAETFLDKDRPLIDTGSDPGIYYENVCKRSPVVSAGAALSDGPQTAALAELISSSLSQGPSSSPLTIAASSDETIPGSSSDPAEVPSGPLSAGPLTGSGAPTVVGASAPGYYIPPSTGFSPSVAEQTSESDPPPSAEGSTVEVISPAVGSFVPQLSPLAALTEPGSPAPPSVSSDPNPTEPENPLPSVASESNSPLPSVPNRPGSPLPSAPSKPVSPLPSAPNGPSSPLPSAPGQPGSPAVPTSESAEQLGSLDGGPEPGPLPAVDPTEPQIPFPTGDTEGAGSDTAGEGDGGDGDDGAEIVTIPDLPISGGGGSSPGGATGDPAGGATGGDGGNPAIPDGGDGSSQTAGEGNDLNCDSSGTCYDVSVQCKDTRIVVQVGTNRPFNGRIYALGRSETCNVAVVNSDRFRLDLSLSGQDCNTQSIGTVYSNTVVVQHHSVVMTKTDKIYKVRCTYDMSSRNITFGMMPISQAAQDPNSEFYDPNFDAESMGQLLIRDPDMISITSAPAAPPPRISILDKTGQVVETVRIGDKLTFRIEIPSNTPYGIFARNCVAMAKDAKSTFQIIDENGCPVDPNIFPRFTSKVYSLESMYEAFRFTESYGVIFQCNVKYCLGECEPAQCDYNGKQFPSWGRRRRRALKPTMLSEDPRDPESMTLSQEIMVLDFGDEEGVGVQRQQQTSRPEVQLPPYVTQEATFGAPAAASAADHFSFTNESVEMLEKCPTKTSVLALSVTCALLVLIYVCSIFYLFMKRWMTRNNKVL
ncbi:uncharacterized protein LOC122364481 isoform X1 [Amphibalanus amphitrite]|uniref:uncharacterized protein LOC122364481 isoform X1 n=1 Tax=Amphibalanus amphitrite TaxID=1232801 RepID=UPI001C8FE232|nr:uncharacterized protein LOC122364481 isoform X1 [Amphibalanus amphitrite]